MKLSQIKQDFEAAVYGEWIQWGDRQVFFRVRGFFVPEYQRALRAVLASLEKLPGDATADQRIERDELVGNAMLPYLCKHALVGWWGLDAEAPLITEAPVDDWQPAIAGVIEGKTLRTYLYEGREYRRCDDADGFPAWQEMVPFSPQAALEAFSDPRCGELLYAARSACSLVDQRTLEAEAEALGKRLSTSSGTSGMETTKKS